VDGKPTGEGKTRDEAYKWKSGKFKGGAAKLAPLFR